MTPIERSVLQKQLIASILASKPDRPMKKDIAAAAGCDPADIAKFEHGQRRLDIDEIMALAEEYGGEAVLGPLAAVFGFHIVPGEVLGSHSAPEVARQAAHLTQSSASFSVAIHEAMADGTLTSDEAEDLERRKMELHADTRRMCLRRVRTGRVA